MSQYILLETRSHYIIYISEHTRLLETRSHYIIYVSEHTRALDSSTSTAEEKAKTGVGEMAQQIKYLLPKGEELSLAPQRPHRFRPGDSQGKHV